MNNSELKKFLDISVLKDTNIKSVFVLRRNFLYKKSIEDGLLKGFCFEGSQNNQDGFYLWCFIQPLFVLSDSITLTFGHRIKFDKSKDWWGINTEGSKVKFFIDKLNNSIKQENEDFLKKISSANDFYKYFFDTRKTNIRIYEAVVYCAFYSGLPEARKESFTLLDYLKNTQDLTIPWIKQIQDNIIEFSRSKDAMIKNKLLVWQTKTVDNLKL